VVLVRACCSCNSSLRISHRLRRCVQVEASCQSGNRNQIGRPPGDTDRWPLTAVRTLARCLTALESPSKYPSAKPEALRLQAPQRGLTATDEKQKNRNSAALLHNGLRQCKSNSGGNTPGILKVLLPPRQSRGNSRDIS